MMIVDIKVCYDQFIAIVTINVNKICYKFLFNISLPFMSLVLSNTHFNEFIFD